MQAARSPFQEKMDFIQGSPKLPDVVDPADRLRGAAVHRSHFSSLITPSRSVRSSPRFPKIARITSRQFGAAMLACEFACAPFLETKSWMRASLSVRKPIATQNGREVSLGVGDACLTSCAAPGSYDQHVERRSVAASAHRLPISGFGASRSRIDSEHSAKG